MNRILGPEEDFGGPPANAYDKQEGKGEPMPFRRPDCGECSSEFVSKVFCRWSRSCAPGVSLTALPFLSLSVFAILDLFIGGLPEEPIESIAPQSEQL